MKTTVIITLTLALAACGPSAEGGAGGCDGQGGGCPCYGAPCDTALDCCTDGDTLSCLCEANICVDALDAPVPI